MRRADVKEARDLAAAFVKATDELLATKELSWDSATDTMVQKPWTDTVWIVGKRTGAHRRLSLDLTRALSHMRRPS